MSSPLPWPLGVTVRAKAPITTPTAELYFLSSPELTGDISLTSALSGGPQQLGPEAGRPTGQSLLPSKGAVAVAAGHSNSIASRAETALSPDVPTHPGLTLTRQERPQRACAQVAGLQKTALRSCLQPAQLASSLGSSSPQGPVAPHQPSPNCPVPLADRAAQSTREQASGITPLILGNVPGENVCSGETQSRPQSLPSPAQPSTQAVAAGCSLTAL
ncbi:Conserved Oligomeric Golgi Complex Subunit 3 [Manis pentadactyla]|nr:Conserved Oligomeric Golgi Complex Subunit 3 [Manis pentadactyla]